MTPLGSAPGPGARRNGATTSGGSLRLPIVLGLVLGATAALLVGVAIRVVDSRDDQTIRGGLEYARFLEGLDEILAVATEDGPVRFDAVEARLPDGRQVRFDTLVVTADPAWFPAFRPGGFLADQVAAYNRFQRERLEITAIDPDAFDRTAALNPSIFRSRRGPGGGRLLDRTGAAWDLQVPSPFAGEWRGEVRAADVHRGAGLFGAGTSIPLARESRVMRTLDGRGRPCAFVPDRTDVLAFCLSEQRIPQVTLRGAAGGPGPATAVAGWKELRVDGRVVSTGDSLRLVDGSVLEIAPLEPLAFGDYWEGVLSTKQWINGRLVRRGPPQPPLDVFAQLGGEPDDGADASSDASIDLTLHARGSLELTRSLERFIAEAVPIPVDFAVVVVATVPDGAIRAVAEIGRRPDRGRSNLLERVAPGSAVKPLLAAAILSERPELATLELPARSGEVVSVLGLPRVPQRMSFETALNCGMPRSGLVNLRSFIRCSNNEYAAALLAAGLWPAGAAEPVPAGDRRDTAFRLGGRDYRAFRVSGGLSGSQVTREALLESPLARGLDRLFDVVVDPVIVDAGRGAEGVWQGLRFSDGRPVRVPPSLRPARSRPALLPDGASASTPLALLYRYAYGAWENRWTVLDLAGAFARLLTARPVELGFAPRPALPPDGALGIDSERWYGMLVGGLRDVAVDGTAPGLAARWARAGLPRSVFAKTGTLTEPGGPASDDDLYSKTLLFGVGERDLAGAALRCGVVGAIYLRFAEGPRGRTLPSYQVEFARERLGTFLAEHWSAFEACPTPDERVAGGS